MIQLYVYTDFVDSIERKARNNAIIITDKCYFVGSPYIKIKGQKRILNTFCHQLDFLIDDVTQEQKKPLELF